MLEQRARMEQESEPQQRWLANSTASFKKRAGSARVPGSATSCSTPHQFSVSVLACAPPHTPSLSLVCKRPGAPPGTSPPQTWQHRLCKGTVCTRQSARPRQQAQWAAPAAAGTPQNSIHVSPHDTHSQQEQALTKHKAGLEVAGQVKYPAAAHAPQAAPTPKPHIAPNKRAPHQARPAMKVGKQIGGKQPHGRGVPAQA